MHENTVSTRGHDSSLLLTVAYRRRLSAAGHRRRPSHVPAPGQRQPRSCRDGKAVGSALIGQPFTDPGILGPPVGHGPVALQRAASGGSNLGPLNPALADAVKARVEALRDADPGNTAPVPVDLVTASGSGLDPAHQPGRGRVPGAARGPYPRHDGRAAARPGGRAHRRPHLRYPRRTASQCVAPQIWRWGGTALITANANTGTRTVFGQPAADRHTIHMYSPS